MIEIDLSKLERGTHTGNVKVTRKGKTFYRKQRIGQKEVDKKIDKELITINELNTAIKNNDVKTTAISDLIAKKYDYTIPGNEPSSYFNKSLHLLTLLLNDNDDFNQINEGDISIEAIEIEKTGDGHKIINTLKDVCRKANYNNITIEAFPKHDDDNAIVTGTDIIELVDWWERQGFEVEYEEDLDTINIDQEYMYQDSMFGESNGIFMYYKLR